MQNCTEARFRDINFTPDKTNKERAEYKKLKAIIATANDPSLVIRRGKIIKLSEKKLQNKKKEAPNGGLVVEDNMIITTIILEWENQIQGHMRK